MITAGVDGAEAPRTQDETEGKYRVLAELGQGGTAVVYLAAARGPSGFNKLVVLKTLKKHLVEDLDLRKMFMKEARLTARLNHPNIVQTYEAVEEQGIPLIVMEYLDGQPLSRILSHNRGELTLAMQLRIVVDVLNGLHYAHELSDFDGTPLGLVHRDMSPQNVFVTYDGQTKLLDFGIAKLASSHGETQTGVIKGKLRYMPAEQIAAENVDRRADIYAIGVMLWEIATGQQIWKGMTEATIMNRVLNGNIPSPRSVAPEVSEELERICVKAMAPDPADRYATAAECEGDLETLIESLGTRSSPRAVGKVVSSLFAESRKKTKALIETQMSTVASLSWQEYEAREAPSLSATTDTQPGLVSTGMRRAGTRPVGRTGAILIALGALGVVGIGVVIAQGLRKGNAPEPARKPEPALPAPVAAPPENTAEPAQPMARLRLSARPGTAKLFLDNEPLPRNPTEVSLPADGARHTIRAELAGYQTAESLITMERDQNVDLVLNRAVPGKALPRPTPAGSGKKNGPSANCDPPYVVDRDGTKKFKLECL